MPTDTLVASNPDRIREDLVDSIQRANGRRRQRAVRIGGTAAALALVAAATASMLWRTEPAYALRQTPDGPIEVEIYPDFDDVDALQDDLQSAGVDAIVVALRGHPSLDGLVEVVSHDGETDGSVVRSFDGHRLVVDPAEFAGPIEILVYHAARDGETYQFAPSIFAEGEVLEGLPCALTDRPLSSAELANRAATVGIAEITWLYHDADMIEEREERPAGIVASAQLASATVLRVTVRPPLDAELPAATLYERYGTNTGSHAEVQPATCTHELAARWN